MAWTIEISLFWVETTSLSLFGLLDSQCLFWILRSESKIKIKKLLAFESNGWLFLGKVSNNHHNKWRDLNNYLHKKRNRASTAAHVVKAWDFEQTQVQCDLTCGEVGTSTGEFQLWRWEHQVHLDGQSREFHILHADWTVLESILIHLPIEAASEEGNRMAKNLTTIWEEWWKELESLTCIGRVLREALITVFKYLKGILLRIEIDSSVSTKGQN